MNLNELDTQKKIILIVIGIGILLLLFALSSAGGASDESGPVLGLTDVQGDELSSHSFFYVEVTGMVNNPGVYQLDKETLVIELLSFAGGLTDEADLEYVHNTLGLSTFVTESQKIFIPPIESGSRSSATRSSDNEKISINNASLESLTSLPGIGNSTAEKIIEARPFDSIESLKEVSGIGDQTYNKIVTLISL